MTYSSLNEAWIRSLRQIYTLGSHVQVRGSNTREVLGHMVSIPMRHPILTFPEREISRRFMLREAWWILSGNNNLNLLTASAPSMKRFSDDGIRLSGAYGPKVVDQLTYAVDALLADPHTRQSVINIWRERPGSSKDIPCTLSIQFTIRENHIHAFVNMRSNDLWLGMPYDVFTFTMITCLVAIEYSLRSGKKVRLGYMHHNAASRHIYEKDSEKALACLKTEPLGFDHGDDLEFDRLLEYCRSSEMFVQLLHDASVGQTHEPLKNTLSWLTL